MVETLRNVFLEARKDGLIVDTIGLAPAFHGMVKDQFVLGVSAPSLSVEELDDHKYNDLEDYPYEGYFGIQRKLPQLYPMD